jgi:hypothetical protein
LLVDEVIKFFLRRGQSKAMLRRVDGAVQA